MRVSEEGLKKFIEIYREEFGEDISIPEARIMATELLNLYKVTCRPIEEKWFDEKNNK